MNKKTYGKQFWDDRYNTDAFLYGEAPNDFLVENLNRLKSRGQILCLSEGEGRNSVYLASKGFHVTGVDLSSVAKEKALKFAVKKGVTIHYDLANLRDYDLGENKWDGIVSIFGHTPSTIRRPLHQKIKRALKPGGIFLLEGYNPGQLRYDSGGPKNEDMLYSKTQLQEDFGDLEILLLQDLVRNVREGPAHSGEASVTQLVAKK